MSKNNLNKLEVLKNINFGSKSVRPLDIENFIGQQRVKDNLTTFITSAKDRDDVLDHVLLMGPPGLGKTTLAQITANEMQSNFVSCLGPSLKKTADLAAILTNLKQFDVLFIDEIHRLSKNLEEFLYSAMEDYKLNIVVGDGISARSITLEIQPFTLIGATTRSGLITSALRSRFAINFHLEFYPSQDLALIISKAANKLNLVIKDDAAILLANSARGTPRIAINLLKRARDFSKDKDIIDLDTIKNALDKLEIDDSGLDKLDRKYLKVLEQSFNSGPAGIEALSAALGLEKDVIEETIEPFLMQKKLITISPRGRFMIKKYIANN